MGGMVQYKMAKYYLVVDSLYHVILQDADCLLKIDEIQFSIKLVREKHDMCCMRIVRVGNKII